MYCVQSAYPRFKCFLKITLQLKPLIIINSVVRKSHEMSLPVYFTSMCQRTTVSSKGCRVVPLTLLVDWNYYYKLAVTFIPFEVLWYWFNKMFENSSPLYPIIKPRPLGLRMGSRPPDMEVSCEYIEKAVVDSRPGKVLQLGNLARG